MFIFQDTYMLNLFFVKNVHKLSLHGMRTNFKSASIKMIQYYLYVWCDVKVAGRSRELNPDQSPQPGTPNIADTDCEAAGLLATLTAEKHQIFLNFIISIYTCDIINVQMKVITAQEQI